MILNNCWSSKNIETGWRYINMIAYYLYSKRDQIILPLGEISFNKFYPDDGFDIFSKMVDAADPNLYNFVVRRSDSIEYITVNEFLTEIEKYKIMID